MKPTPTLSRRSILRGLPAMALAAAAVVVSANQADAANRGSQAATAPDSAPQRPGHHRIIGVL
ncbi:hypothetical protein [Arthrobacter sp. M4]|uniref:hypothetical protein n=1 Tax=Arthrobacter sp. M4 TaxID=218160 RepID=UPI001CDB5081|nr:hypothetical protein [Arthrobacter sp. M4]MCA4135207.1 hypothetical protein [Arthrobacter sp. M4]